MKDIFSPNVSDRALYILSDSHVYALLGISFTLTLVLWYAIYLNDHEKRRRLRIGIASFMILVEISWHVWAVSVGVWHVNHALPLHLCSVSAILSIFMLINRNYNIFELLYFTIGITSLISDSKSVEKSELKSNFKSDFG